MRTARLIITTLLTLQLFATAGLSGGVCCATDADRGASAAEDNYEPATEEKIESGHCPMHAAKEAKPKSQARERHQSSATQRSTAAERRSHQTRSSSATGAHFCACSVERRERPFDALLQRASEQRPAVQVLPGALNAPRCLIEFSPPQNISSDSFQPHSPPFSGRQLHLRI